MTAPSPLTRHIDNPAGPRHRLTATDQRHLRCHDCGHTLLLPAPTTGPAATSTSTSPPPLHAPDRCQLHPGQTNGACGPCRAEQLEAQRSHEHQPTADVRAGAAAARAALARGSAPIDRDTPEEQA